MSNLLQVAIKIANATNEVRKGNTTYILVIGTLEVTAN